MNETVEELQFTTDWFTASIPIREKALASFVGKNNLSYLEVGVFEGRSLLWTFENILTAPGCKATVIDPFSADQKARFLHNLEMTKNLSRTTILEGFSHEKLSLLFGQKFDFIYLDGSHKAKAILYDTVLAWELLKTDGVLIIDDYLWNFGSRPIDMAPKSAVDNFLTLYGDELEVVYCGYQMIVRKTKESDFDQETSFLSNDLVFCWETYQLFRLKKEQPEPLPGVIFPYCSANLSHIAELIELEPSEHDAVVKYLMSKKAGQVKPDMHLLNSEERTFLQNMMNQNG